MKAVPDRKDERHTVSLGERYGLSGSTVTHRRLPSRLGVTEHRYLHYIITDWLLIRVGC
jgi:hypothetical protein